MLETKAEADDGSPLRLARATTCLTRFSKRPTRSLNVAFSICRLARVALPIGATTWGIGVGEGEAITGLTSGSRSAGGGATFARLTPPDELTISGGMPRSLASEMTLCAGEASLSVDLARVGGGVSPERSARFSASSSLTRCSR